MERRLLAPENYYRLPWNMADNAITWLEPTTKCNLNCEGCYREKGDHRPLDSVIQELEGIKRVRRTDGISIAGGEPLMYPDLLNLVRYVASQGWKPIIITNGTLLTPELIKDLKAAGLVAFTVHVDSHQGRPGWIGKGEAELNELRLHLAEMIHEAGQGQIATAFNATIYRDTLPDIPILTRWAQDHMDIVHTMVYILFRSVKSQAPFDTFVLGQPVDPTKLVYQLDQQEQHQDVAAQEIEDQILGSLARIRALRLPERHRGPPGHEVASQHERGKPWSASRFYGRQIRRVPAGGAPLPLRNLSSLCPSLPDAQLPTVFSLGPV